MFGCTICSITATFKSGNFHQSRFFGNSLEFAEAAMGTTVQYRDDNHAHETDSANSIIHKVLLLHLWPAL